MHLDQGFLQGFKRKSPGQSITKSKRIDRSFPRRMHKPTKSNKNSSLMHSSYTNRTANLCARSNQTIGASGTSRRGPASRNFDPFSKTATFFSLHVSDIRITTTTAADSVFFRWISIRPIFVLGYSFLLVFRSLFEERYVR